MDWKLFAIFLSNFLCCLTYDVIAPFYPVEAQHLGISHFKTGLVFTFMPLAGFVVAPVVGSMLYKLGRRWTFTAASWFFLLSLVARMLAGIGTGCVYTVCNSHTAYAYIASDYPTNMNELIAFTETFSGFGLVIGPVVGAGLYVAAGYEGVFIGLCVLFLIGSVVIYYLLHEDKPYVIVEEDDNNIFHLASKFPILVNCLPIAFSMIAIGFCDTVIGPHFETFGLTPLTIGFLWALSDSGYMIFSCILAKTIDILDLKLMNLVGAALVVCAYLLLGPWPVLFPRYLSLVVVGLTLISLAIAMHYISALPNLIQVAESDLGLVKDDILIDSLSAFIASATCFGEMLGPVMAGFMVDLDGVEQAGVYFGFAEMAVFVLYLIYYWRSPKVKIVPEVEKQFRDSLLTTE